MPLLTWNNGMSHLFYDFDSQGKPWRVLPPVLDERPERCGDPEPDPILAEAIDLKRVSRPQATMWVRLTFDDGRPERSLKGFALA